jgi:putative ABC transport system ATP-binding protein
MSEPLIQIQSVVKQYTRDTQTLTVLDGLSLTVDEGDFMALMGPSGSGKTTLLNLIAGIDRPTKGRILVGKDEVSSMSEGALARWRSQNVGFIFQLYNLVPVLTAFENVELPLLLTNLSRARRKQQAELALSVVGLTDRKDHYPRQLSGGQEQRVAIARAIATDPKLLVADEPTGDLDAKAGEEILILLERLNSEFHKTIVMVTHDPRAASRAHRLVHLDKGVLKEDIHGARGAAVGMAAAISASAGN